MFGLKCDPCPSGTFHNGGSCYGDYSATRQRLPINFKNFVLLLIINVFTFSS